MNTIFHLSTCSTCQRIIRDLNLEAHGFTFQDIKTEPLTEAQVDAMAEAAGSYEALFSRRAMKYRSMGLNEMDLGEQDYRKYILEEYTFLKRPVMWVDGALFVGNTKKVVEAVREKL